VSNSQHLYDPLVIILGCSARSNPPPLQHTCVVCVSLSLCVQLTSTLSTFILSPSLNTHTHTYILHLVFIASGATAKRNTNTDDYSPPLCGYTHQPTAIIIGDLLHYINLFFTHTHTPHPRTTIIGRHSRAAADTQWMTNTPTSKHGPLPHLTPFLISVAAH